MPANIPLGLVVALQDRYTLNRPLGEGGMATVYLARDLRHDRQVALKVLRPEIASAVGPERFLQEIRVTANLQHPHILPLHDSGEAGGYLYYVMPFVEGVTLRALIDRDGPLAVEQAVEVGRKLAAALHYAHRQGVIHRDIKPENILLHDGEPVVADFGIALAVSEASPRLTRTGFSMGTPTYMSPEQASGKGTLDARTDVYSLGAVVYEMLTGEAPFAGSTAQAVVAKVLAERPTPVEIVRDTVPPHVSAAVHRALAKMPADRFQTAADFADALARPDTMSGPRLTATRPTPLVRLQRWHMVALGFVAAIIGGVALGATVARPAGRDEVERFELFGDRPPTGGVAVSPDGRTIVGAWPQSDGAFRLLVRRLDRVEATPLPGTAGAYLVAFSPDGREVVYGFGNGMRRAALAGTAPVAVVDSGYIGVGLAWGRDGNIYFGRPDGSLARVPAAGGEIERLTEADPGAGVLHGWPAVLPGGRGVVFTMIRTRDGEHEIAVLDLRSRVVQVVTRGTRPQYVASGELLYVDEAGALVALPFDERGLAPRGTPRPVAHQVARGTLGNAAYGVAADAGTLVYLAGAPIRAGRSLAVVDHAGRARALAYTPGNYSSLAISPDGRRIAVEIEHGTVDGGDIFLGTFGDTTWTRLTFTGVSSYPAFTPDGGRVAFGHATGPEREIVARRVDGAGGIEPLLRRTGPQYEVSFAPGGAFAVREGNASVGDSLRVFRAAASGDGIVALDGTRGRYRAPRVSPDGRWLAYVSDESGRAEVYVRPFADVNSGAVWQVSTDNGTEPVWSRSGRVLFYKGSGGMTAVDVTMAPTFSIVRRRVLFPVGAYLNSSWHARYDVLRGDSAFVMIRTAQDTTAARAVMVRNWRAELGR